MKKKQLLNDDVPGGKKTVRLAVYAPQGEPAESEAVLAEHLGVPLFRTPEACAAASLLLRRESSGLTLTDGELSLCGDFTRMLPRLKQNNLSVEPLVKAAKRRDYGELPSAVDATAGMGEDALLLATAGFRVRLYEYDPVIAALLRDTLERAKLIPELAETAARMELFEENSVDALRRLPFMPDIVFLDPMFPERQKSASVKKKFQLLQQLESPCSEENDLLQSAIAANPRKIVIKRPQKGPVLADMKPDYSIPGSAIRYDCIFVRKSEKETKE